MVLNSWPMNPSGVQFARPILPPGRQTRTISASDQSHRLSPFDPLLFGMFGARAMALVRLGRFDEAAEWAVKAAARPNAHAHILAIAALSLALAGRFDDARAYMATINKTLPRYRIDDFLAAMKFDPDGEGLLGTVRRALASADDSPMSEKWRPPAHAELGASFRRIWF